jgi:3D-(3,5/4)-trihydroxycyclohexane-1,2-dione acylhydrolase (decyclizing)
VVAVVGDGAYTMLHTGPLTAMQEGSKIVVVLGTSGFRFIDDLEVSQAIAHLDNECKRRNPARHRRSPTILRLWRLPGWLQKT